MKHLLPSKFLQRVLLADALVSMLVAALQLGLTRSLAGLLGLSHDVLFESGVFLVGYALLLVWLARGKPVPSLLLWGLVIGNAGWALGCVAVGVADQPGVLGVAFLLAQALTVLVFAGLEFAGIRASTVTGGVNATGAALR
ncbi:hypothetical protein [Massilia sp. 9I]|uniref:hypothetical protein n=1 Tax=Massilia sp. 9I TaxID=2653152 RepID=UPI0012F29810|nr:hypothetical protein [Massilia sp. 9I]VXB60326.1 conserved membrane hypothetical protein [Massilia sp. 9I]